jgi:hypothetical protein
MSTDLAPLQPPPISQAVAELLRRWEASPREALAAVTPTQRDEARRKLPAMERALAPAYAAAWQRFLAPIAGAVRNPPSPDELRAFAATCAASLTTIPAAALTRDAQAALCRSRVWWPAVAELAEHFEPDFRAMRAKVRALHAIALAPVAAPAPPPMTETEREIASAQLAELASDLRARGLSAREAKPRASTLPPATLAALYRDEAERLEQAGRPDNAAAFRLRANRLEGITEDA